MSRSEASPSRAIRAFLLIAVMVAISYANTFLADWHLDDYPGIVYNDRLHPGNLEAESLRRTFFAHPGGSDRLYRPVANLTFALNWYIGNGDRVGFHAVNVGIHVLAAFMLFATVMALLETPNARGGGGRDRYFVALLAACLWALNPIQTQAVTYIVQRMATLVTLFYLGSLYAYVRGRLSVSAGRKAAYFAASLAAFFLATGCKENAVMLPAALFITEALFFQDLGRPEDRRRLLVWGGLMAAGVLVIGVVFFLDGRPLAFLSGYQSRPFSLAERLLTAPRILVFYLFQIVALNPANLSLVHETVVSTGPLTPWSTLPAMALVAGLVGCAVALSRRHPVFSWAVLFFFLNHLIEATVIPLELVFEHRNYLPSLFLFFPVAIGVSRLVNPAGGQRTVRGRAAIICVVAILMIAGTSTYFRNDVWRTGDTMLADMLKKAPGDIRTRQSLAVYYGRQGELDKALALYREIAAMQGQYTRETGGFTFNNMGNIYQQQGRYAEATRMFEQVLAVNPRHQAAHYNLALVFLKTGQLERAQNEIDTALSRERDHDMFLNLKGLILIRQQRYAEAAACLRRVLQQIPGHRGAAINLSAALDALGRHASAGLLLRHAHDRHPDDPQILVYLIQNRLQAGDGAGAAVALEKLAGRSSISDIGALVERIARDPLAAPLSLALMHGFLSDTCTGISAGMISPAGTTGP